ncbi:hypothetical protein [Burkholderia thailandensis]|uniref:Uncharacterized protein n=1 Tax=Burkholderia thailandensis (strain ATCC 700388 / DSM 13276 / CCUG 48851 / CIP 106301 / E264) TaxID=271848 RepID=Q2T2X3_BURTA|nr:hypothetical protein [Burkholderia thailandensis]ABC35964.1 conserved hypothetical protein [Burkholderia thailandensis E264]AHI77230.1 hypothetical protein BTQ_5576 [Burkholderia thailandensis 2002721723]AHI82689.1 hypothetical protein BTJ_4231 [Burkholderia thailandensis E444]AIC89247.1 hypothetical protein BTRA_4965 [Burkholderia thailandensis USAMRU Malaysia \
MKKTDKNEKGATATALSPSNIGACIRLPCSGQFYVLERALDKPCVTGAFNGIEAALDAQTAKFAERNEAAVHAFEPVSVRCIREKRADLQIDGVTVGVTLSSLTRSFLRSPLLAPDADVAEARFAHVLLLELNLQPVRDGDTDAYLYLYRELSDDPLDHGLRERCVEIGPPAFIEPFVQPDATRIERMSMRMMAASRGEIRRKTIDAYDVGAATSSLGLHRTIAGSMTLAVPHGGGVRRFDVSPHRQRVRAGTSRLPLDKVIHWAAERAVGFSRSSTASETSSAFLSQFAQPIARLLDKTPSSVLIERRAFAEAIGEYAKLTGLAWVAGRGAPDTWKTLDDALDAVSDTFVIDGQGLDGSGAPIDRSKPFSEAFYPSSTPSIPGLKPTDRVKLKVGSRTCKVILPSALGYVGTAKDAQRRRLDEILNQSRAFRAVFDGGRALFCSEGAYGSDSLTLATKQLAGIFRGVRALGGVHSEKGETHRLSTSFQTQSCFHVIETDSALALRHSALICDDSTVEWADYIELDSAAPRIRWMHAKVQKIESEEARKARKAKKALPSHVSPTVAVQTSPSLSASDLEEVVGQAIKNLARLRISTSDPEFSGRYDTWVSKTCALPSSSSIDRLRRLGKLPAKADIKKRFDAAAADPHAVYEVAIVVPNYSKKAVEGELAKIKTGKAQPSVLQMFWLLSGFMHACLEVGAKPLVFMHE